MVELKVGLGDRSYPIIIEKDCLLRVARELTVNQFGNKYGIVADSNVAELYGDGFLNSLTASGINAELIVFPAGETSKSLAMIGTLSSELAKRGFDRKDCLIAFGGGVTGDLTGFLAATYMRGIPFVQVPTTLLAQVDSSVGGKTGVDIPEGKNLVGAFYQPKAVYIDSSLLVTLPSDELLGGLGEVIKYGVIKDKEFFNFLAENRQKILNLDHQIIENTVHRCCEIKAEVVAEDEREGGVRRILNYGHTIGHAVEGASSYTLIHGFAVSIGMVAVAKIAVLNELLTEQERDEIINVLTDYGLPTEVPQSLDRKTIKQYLLTDKKVEAGAVFYVIPTQIGDTIITDKVSEDQVDAVLE